MTFNLAQATCEKGGWARQAEPARSEINAAEQRWIDRSYQTKHDDADPQCGGCEYFAALGADFGICWNEESPLDGNITFEHGGCPAHSEEYKKPTLARHIEAVHQFLSLTSRGSVKDRDRDALIIAYERWLNDRPLLAVEETHA